MDLNANRRVADFKSQGWNCQNAMNVCCFSISEGGMHPRRVVHQGICTRLFLRKRRKNIRNDIKFTLDIDTQRSIIYVHVSFTRNEGDRRSFYFPNPFLSPDKLTGDGDK